MRITNSHPAYGYAGSTAFLQHPPVLLRSCQHVQGVDPAGHCNISGNGDKNDVRFDGADAAGGVFLRAMRAIDLSQ